MVSMRPLGELRDTSEVAYRDGKAGCHPVQIVGVVAHGHDLGDDGLTSPVHAKHLSQLLQVVRRSLADREDGISKPSHAQVAQLLVEELNTELAR